MQDGSDLLEAWRFESWDGLLFTVIREAVHSVASIVFVESKVATAACFPWPEAAISRPNSSIVTDLALEPVGKSCAKWARSICRQDRRVKPW